MLILFIFTVILFVYMIFFDYDFLLNFVANSNVMNLNIAEVFNNNFYHQAINNLADEEFERQMLEVKRIYLIEEKAQRNLFLAKSLFVITVIIFLIKLNSTFSSS